ncbi:hypothetical protein [Wolbachia endosymbiont of Ctenocephalides felis wCfeT]|uniref:hypothetical protein n=1 Tax=Wolbachia endosymbiont of Ctenocephalides felis wCfeT TaxID=2732593 RepID=UPI0014477479|nr:hypothetical protein [Wolbachia endosymbiont of Ctenocephalides felis wCfeT]
MGFWKTFTGHDTEDIIALKKGLAGLTDDATKLSGDYAGLTGDMAKLSGDVTYPFRCMA